MGKHQRLLGGERMGQRRDTGTGLVLESMILPSLKRGGYIPKTQQNIGQRIGGGKHIVDIVAEKDDKKILISVKWQQVSGTAEQKLPFEVICLVKVLQKGNYCRAYIVCGGEGWKLRDFYISGGLKKWIPNMENLKIVTLENFVALANQGRL